MRVSSWNVNGLRALARKEQDAWIFDGGNDIVGVQEVRAFEDQIPDQAKLRDGFHTHFAAAKRPGYSGVGLYSRFGIDDVSTSLGVSQFDDEGRLQIARIGQLVVANVYFPNGNGKDRDNSRIPFKLDFYKRLLDELQALREKYERVLVMGDFNTAHQEIDLARPKENVNTSGFCKEERDELERWLQSGWVDTFRSFNKEAGHYSWWSQRQQARERNVGWRIDYVLASTAAMPFVKGAFIQPHTLGSDHCPVGVDLDESVLTG
jgi:exodeoxyribonuclease-3